MSNGADMKSHSKRGTLTKEHHVGFEAAAWYWHFVDVVWLFLFVSIYWELMKERISGLTNCFILTLGVVNII